MAQEKELTKREQVWNLIEKGTYTKAMMAEELNISEASVASQFSYLRLMGRTFLLDTETKIYATCTQEEWDAFEAEKATRKAAGPAAAKLTPTERLAKVNKTIANQEKQYANLEAKLPGILEVYEQDPCEENEDFKLECEANMTLLIIKLKRNQALADSLVPLVDVKDVEDEGVEDEGAEGVEGDGDDELL
jgi:hypothetical protein